MAPGAPVIHPDRTTANRIADRPAQPRRGDPWRIRRRRRRRSPTSAVTYEATFHSHRVQHAALETHGGLAWLDDAGVLNVRTSTQVPFLTRRALSDIFELPMDKVRVFCERVGGGFGGKQEMFVEDILALAALKTGRPVKLELTREEQFIATSTRHPMRVHIKAGADADGKLTALQLDVLSNTGAYGNHAGPVMFHSLSESIAVYNCPNKKVDGFAVYTNTVPSGAFRGYGLPQTLDRGRSRDRRVGASSSASAPTRCAAATSSSPAIPCCRRRRPNFTTCSMAPTGSTSASTSSSARCRPIGPQPDLSPEWLIGDGVALTMIDTVPPGRPSRGRDDRAQRRRRLRPHRRHRRVRQRHQHRAPADRRDDARDHRRPDPPAPVRHRPWRPRHRRLWQRGHVRCGQGDACGRRCSLRPN